MLQGQVFTLAVWAAWAGLCATVWMLWSGPGVLLYFGAADKDLGDPSVWLVGGMIAIALWLILRRMRRGILIGRATLWSSFSALMFVWIGTMLALRHPADWALWIGPPVLGLALFVLALEPYLKGER